MIEDIDMKTNTIKYLLIFIQGLYATLNSNAK